MLLAAALVAASPALACSVVPGYQVPTGLEMAVRSEAIIVGEVVGARKGADAWDSSVRVRPLALLKGRKLPATIEIGHTVLAPPGAMITRSAPRELRAPNPDALAGSCSRYAFTKGMKLVLFLVRDKQGKLTAFRSPFARDSEDVAGVNALWVKAVREYAAFSALPEARRTAEMRKRIAALTAKGDADSLALAKDIGIELSGKRRAPFD